jgi:hypothetical protein
MIVRIRVLRNMVAGGTKTTYSVLINRIPCGEYETQEDLLMCIEGHGFRANRDDLEVVY